jgi:hypothetical protein
MYYNNLCPMSIKERQYVCLIWRSNMNFLMNFPTRVTRFPSKTEVMTEVGICFSINAYVVVTQRCQVLKTALMDKHTISYFVWVTGIHCKKKPLLKCVCVFLYNLKFSRRLDTIKSSRSHNRINSLQEEIRTNQPIKKLTMGGVLRKRQTYSLIRFDHSCVRNALLEMVKGALKL